MALAPEDQDLPVADVSKLDLAGLDEDEVNRTAIYRDAKGKLKPEVIKALAAGKLKRLLRPGE